MDENSVDDLDYESRNKLRSSLLTYTGDVDLRSCENPINMPKHVAQIYNESVATKGTLLLPFISLLIGTPVKMSDSDLENVFDEMVNKTSRRSAVAAGITEKLQSFTFQDFKAKFASIPHMTLSGTTCRVSKVCDACDFAITIAELVGCSYVDAAKCYGSGFGHASMAKGFTPFHHKRLSSKRKTDFQKLGFTDKECNVRWGAERKIASGTLRKVAMNKAITNFLAEARTITPEREDDIDSEVAEIMKDPVPAPVQDSSHLMSVDTALALSSEPDYNCVSPPYEAPVVVTPPPNASSKRSLDSDTPKPPDPVPARTLQEDTSRNDKDPNIEQKLDFLVAEQYEP